jgi:ABC-type lipoprotein export system ATPase subunit
MLDRVYSEEMHENDTFYNIEVLPMVTQLTKGVSGSIILMGPSGSGKTGTLHGSEGLLTKTVNRIL